MVGIVVGCVMRLRDAIVAAIRYDVELAKKDRSDTLRINDKMQFISSGFRSKYQQQPEVRLNAVDCLSEDWYLIRDGKEFLPDSYYYF